MMYRRYRVPSMWQEMDRLQREMNRLFDNYPNRSRTAAGYPAMNIWSSEEGQVVTAEVPGVNPDDIDISVVGETLTLNGVRSREELPENTRFHRQERSFGPFSRTIQLPYQVDANKVEATFKNGILQIKLPRAEADKPKKIVVKSA